ncbi:aminotransferase class I/II-fold pyridoxal phosphate-dependent enzyme [Silvanigrella aquatica]|uniref:Aminotransferase class I/classII large domain-containing protein n=1 Tax=Silvanigrella aquatica TaxID=1915309 RepID=A0A1L4D0D1_9BACT|nr:aminotransferase class I/II-fold pyridoxal phosphate-dependent enzyme [Silvanigrella aquatica]APJ03656.1 hypothetical protein AXG55_06940 [Silvanigrella aquatica]
MSQNNWQQKMIHTAKKNQDNLFQSLNNLNFISRNEKKVTLEDNIEYTEFLSCSYLGLDQDSRLISSVGNELEKTGILFSSSRTRLKHKSFDILTDSLNNIFNAQTVFFSSTHLAHLGLIPLLASGELPGFQFSNTKIAFLLDKSVHASIKINRGMMQQFGSVELMDFSNIEILKEKMSQLKMESITPLLFSDSVCSMGGVMDIVELLSLAQKYDGFLYLDDAHGMSIYGKHGSGYVLDQFNHVLPERLLLVTSLAKGFGTYGGAVALPNTLATDFVKKYCSTYLFSGPAIIPLINASIASANIHLSSEITTLQNTLLDKIKLFDKLCNIGKDKTLNFGIKSPIRGVFIGEECRAIQVGVDIKKLGHLVNVAAYPTTKSGNCILRICISANHTDKEISQLCKAINQVLN